MTATKDGYKACELHITKIGGATYEVNSRYVGTIPLLDLLKQMLKRDLERTDSE